MKEFLLNFDMTPFLLSFKLASITTLILFTIGVPFAWILSQSRSKYKPFIEAIIALPIVLPPTVLGFYILVALSPNSYIGEFFEQTFGIKLVFNFTGLVVASCFYSLPFMIQPLQSGFELVNKHIIEASYLAGKTKFQTLVKIVLPNIKPSLIVAIVITFAHTVGEFGIVLIIGGSIPNETKVVSIAIYEMIETMDYTSAYIYSSIMIIISFITLLIVYTLNRKAIPN